ncbi:NYN domain-containing protein [Lichenihabitans sp. Uapishka_5]|uniref:NYN domain-containing protein n=1 Tax=Lichenihabitans sp. Uapishka_5 TaxID=3037302 RepID=UPI0029E7CF2C|nr:NYN domain-containing protein [Lichenihabitans sp. Uapishka_5]MDX7953619.1 NYN domain-containing protein [Lichenihabitans sp. Uapishka_5]
MAVLVDGGFFLKRLRSIYPATDPNDAKAVADVIHAHALRHKEQRTSAGTETFDLHRIFFYDCPPLAKKMHFPVSKRGTDFAKSSTAVFRLALHEHLRSKRKVALRMGHLLEASEWRLKPGVLKDLLNKARAFDDLTDEDFAVETSQKGVDMRLGLDVASLAYKQQVDQVILIVGDSDFVPAAKLARREGLDVVLDRLGAPVHESLNEHIDGVRTFRGPSVRQVPVTARFGGPAPVPALTTPITPNGQ